MEASWIGKVALAYRDNPWKGAAVGLGGRPPCNPLSTPGSLLEEECWL